MEAEVLVVSIKPFVDGVGFAAGVALDQPAFSLDDRRVGRLAGELWSDEHFDADGAHLELASHRDSGSAREERVVVEAHLANEHAVVLDHVMVVCK